MTWRRAAFIIFCLTIALGATVAISWVAFGGRLAATGPLRALQRSALLIYGSQAVLAAVVGLVASWLVGRATRPRALILLMCAGWLGELAFLTVGGSILVANELDPEIAWFYWLLATAGPMQPVAASAGSLARLAVRGWALRA